MKNNKKYLKHPVGYISQQHLKLKAKEVAYSSVKNSQQLKMPKMMIAIFFLAVATLSTASPVRNQRQAPCNHPLRITRPELFTHCDCTYSSVWSEWEIVEGSTIGVPTSQCASGQAYNEQRRKTAFGDNCNDQTETRRVCKCDI